MREEKLLNYMKTSCHGRENRKSGKELARTLGIHVKDLQKLVKRLRKKKKPIASDQYGYYYAATAAELCDSMDFLQGMADGLSSYCLPPITSGASSASKNRRPHPLLIRKGVRLPFREESCK